jgi:putative FmdB family regulatory protein
MPTYEYECEGCKKKFEVMQSMKDAEFKVHNEAEKCTCYGKVVRLISGGAGVIFKGKGWTRKYHTKGGKTKNRIDAAIKEMGIPDESGGYTTKEDE